MIKLLVHQVIGGQVREAQVDVDFTSAEAARDYAQENFPQKRWRVNEGKRMVYYNKKASGNNTVTRERVH